MASLSTNQRGGLNGWGGTFRPDEITTDLRNAVEGLQLELPYDRMGQSPSPDTQATRHAGVDVVGRPRTGTVLIVRRTAAATSPPRRGYSALTQRRGQDRVDR
jgi:hypothetical protein